MTSNQYASLSEAQIAEFKECFAVFDANQDGAIDEKELLKAITSLGGGATDKEIKDIMNDIEPNGGGVMHFPNFLVMMARKQDRMQDGDDEKEMREAFALFDPTGKKKVSKDDIKRVLTTVGEKLTDAEVDEMLKMADKDNDRMLNWGDFSAIMKEASATL
eukprot:gb/GEZN01011401.1/.p2 GENE.gb/GEZN01011401.1/~~gb/GEZN01011401.1/.p2  ORF type:complete len:161 (+),score=42.26 gb/GEZN01011401.1/:159-641(+)